ncbi:hypothetical protein [Leptospira neocaledonica]|uniref:hypothetical protein n=1 Tax=Leptospira neocaledonica TaxID=2023192 RepID=UPI001FCB90BA|nr:hypothetical protein [Leptospira neocaledonica]
MKKVKDLESLKNQRAQSTEAKRLLFAVKNVGFKEVESKTGVTQHTLQRWARNNDKIEDMLLNELLLECGISKIYVRTWKGRWEASTEERVDRFNELVKDAVNNQQVKEDVQLKRIMDLVVKLDLGDKELIINMCHKLLQEKKNDFLRSLISLLFNLPKAILETAYKLLLGLEKNLYDK